MSVQITIVGLGQIGSSIGLALKAHDVDVHRVGHDKDPQAAKEAQKAGAVDDVKYNLPASDPRGENCDPGPASGGRSVKRSRSLLPIYRRGRSFWIRLPRRRQLPRGPKSFCLRDGFTSVSPQRLILNICMERNSA